MIIYLQIILITVLVFTLLALYFDERQKRKSKTPTAKLTHFWEESERRSFVRIDADVPIKYSLPKGPNTLKNGRMKNLSLGGIGMTLNEKFNPKDSLLLEIGLPDSSAPIIAKGEIAWVKENTAQKDPEGVRHFDVGIEFKELSPKDRDRLLKFIKDRGKTQCV